MPPEQPINLLPSAPPRRTYLFVVSSDVHHTGGVNQVVFNLHREMHLAGEFEPLIMVDEWSAWRPLEKVVDGRRVLYMRLWPSWAERSSIIGVFKLVLASPMWMFDLLRIFRRNSVVAVNYHFPSVSVITFALLRSLRLYRGALILSFHGLDLRNAQETGRIEHALWRFVFRYATAIVACSRAFAADVSAFAGKAARSVRAIQNGLDPDHFRSNVQHTGGPPFNLSGRNFIVSVATWEWKKGLDVLLHAFAKLRRTHSEIGLVLIGRSGAAEQVLRRLAADLGIAEDVSFIGEIPHAQVAPYLKRAKAFCLPSRAEPFGIAILEAGAFCLPVVASRVGGIPEIVSHGETGLLVEPDDAEALAVELDRVLSDSELARRLGESLYRRVVEVFSWKRAYQEYLALFARR